MESASTILHHILLQLTQLFLLTLLNQTETKIHDTEPLPLLSEVWLPQSSWSVSAVSRPDMLKHNFQEGSCIPGWCLSVDKYMIMHPSFRQTVIQIICIFYCTCIIYHTLTIWLSTLEDVTHFHHCSHNVHISFGDLGAGWVCQYSIESHVESYYMTRMRKKIPHKNWAVRIGTASFSATKREWGEAKSCCVNLQQKSKQEVFLLLRVFIIMIIISVKTVESKGLKIKSVWWTTLLLSRKVCVSIHHHHPTQVLGFRV